MFADGGWGWNGETGALYRSVDAGRSWQIVRIPSGEILNFRGSAFLDTNTAWLAGQNQTTGAPRLLHTTDGGTTAWTEINPEGLESMAGNFDFHFINPEVGWAEAAEGGAGNLYVQVFKTDDAGASSKLVPIRGDPPGTVHLCNMCADSFYYDPSRVMIVTGDMGSMQPRGQVLGMTSFDQGQTWEANDLPLPPKYHDALVLPLSASFVDDRHGFLPVLLLHNEDSSVYRVLALYTTGDGAKTWSIAPGLLEDMPNYPRLQFLNPTEAVAQCAGALCITQDAGASWEARPLPPEMLPFSDRILADLDFVDPQTGWVVISEFSGGSNHYKLYKTDDGAKTWTPQ
jgi:hypothetical protein